MIECGSDAGPMCAQKLDEDSQETTLGQRLLKEPIWIGLIVILSVVMLFGILYIIRRKCGKHFHCCDIKKPKAPDDNILNADGTITLNSFPLRKIARPPTLSPINASPSPPRSATTKNETPTPTPGVKNEGAAARFFASYKDAERSPIAAPLTTDFSRTTDTSLSQDAGDASVGAMVGGRLQLDLHIRENKEEQEAMTRTHSLLEPSHRSKERIKRSHSTGPFLVRQETKFDEFSLSPGHAHAKSKDKRVTINDFEHIYPTVIVHSPPPDEEQHSDDGSDLPQKSSTEQPPAMRYVDPSGAHVIEVNFEGDSESAEPVASIETAVQCQDNDHPLWKEHHSHSADSIYHLEQDDEYDFYDVEREKLELYADVIREWKNRARQRYRIAKLAAQREKDEYYSSRRWRSRDRYNRKLQSRSSPCINHMGSLKPHPIRRTHTVEEDPVYLDDVARRREDFSGKAKRLYSSLEKLDYYDEYHIRRPPSLPRKLESAHSSCECVNCYLHRSGSLASDKSSVTRSIRSSRSRNDGHLSQRDRERQRREKEKCRSYSASSDKVKYSRRQRQDSVDSHKHKQNKMRKSSSDRSLRSLRVNPGSSTDSDLFRGNSRSPRSHQKYPVRPTSGNSTVAVVMQEKRSIPPLPPPPPAIQITKTPSSDALEKDMFRKVFSQEVELDDFSPVEEDDDDLIYRPKTNSKEYFLSSDPPCDYSCVDKESNNDNGSPQHCTIAIDNVHESKNAFTDTSSTAPFSSEVPPRRNSVVTISASSIEGQPISTRNSFDRHNIRETTSSGSGTPPTCNVIMYDSNKSLDNHDTPPTIKSRSFFLSRKHSSLDLTEPLRLLQPSQQILRNASSMQELSNIPQQDEEDSEGESSGQFVDKGTGPSDTELEHPQIRLMSPAKYDAHNKGYVSSSNSGRPQTIDIQVANVENETTPSTRTDQRVSATASSLSSSEDVSPQQRRDSTNSNPNIPNSGSAQYLSVTDTDSAMSSAPSPQSTPSTSKTVISLDRSYAETRVKDSAYQTKQSSVDVEAGGETRVRRPVAPIREEDRKVTQRLHQAAVKLLVMQQRLRRARQNMSKDSAVHTISEDDATLDDIIVTSPKTRTFKPGVLYPAAHQEEAIPEFPPLQCARIVEEQDVMLEYEV